MKWTGDCACCAGCETKAPEECVPWTDGERMIALVGQPNAGKSTLFNRITGAHQHVGNWPGKTVEKKEGRFRLEGKTGRIFDLPGTYSLSANSTEEIISRDFILSGQPDAVIAVVDATQLERTLYMVAELSLLELPVVIALNKMDVVADRGIRIDASRMEALVGMPVVPVSAIHGKGIDALISRAANPPERDGRLRPDMDAVHGEALARVTHLVDGSVPAGWPTRWMALALLEGDPDITKKMQARLSEKTWDEVRTLAESGRRKLAGAGARYDWVKTIVAGSRRLPHVENVELVRFDKWALHPGWGKMMAIGALLFGLLAAYFVAMPLMVPSFLVFFAIGPVREALASIGPVWLADVIGNGLLAGISLGGMILGFVGAVFLVLGFFENTGYMARLACLFDPFMRRLGMHGKSILPMIMGLACNIAGVAGSRSIDTDRQRMMTMVVMPIIPCKSLLVVVAFISGIFLGSHAVWVMLALFVTMFLHIQVTSLFWGKVFLPGETSGLIMELPPYQKPDWRSILLFSLTRMKGFLYQGFPFIVLFTFLSWAGIYFPDGNLNTSYFAQFGRFMEPFGRFMGFDWRLCISFVVAFVSKEATLCAMAIIFGAATSESAGLMDLVLNKDIWAVVHGGFDRFLAQSGVSPASALGFVFAVFFSLPCVATLGMLYNETRSLKWTGGMLAYYFLASVTMGAMAYHIGLQIF